ncbi:hypothetical protein ACIP79_18035 [Streptomyces sp. NPDC088747]|uniref:hypothetical protein n=1 Tax=Streptomyces sp. NPDC088747 TaxID=3365886 RepID=UPI00382B7C54
MSEHRASLPEVDAPEGIPLRLLGAPLAVRETIRPTAPGGIVAGGPAGSRAWTGRAANGVSTATSGVTFLAGTATGALSRGRFDEEPGRALRASADRTAR